MKQVNEVKMNKVIPFNKPKSGLSVRKEQLINKTLLKLDEYLSRINKFSVRELTEYGDGVWEDDLTGVFDRFYIDEDESETKYECYFDYDTSEKCMIFYTKLLKEGFPIGRSGGKFPKKTIKQIVSRKKMSIWLSQIMFPSFGTETEMKEFYQRCVFHNENNIIIWDRTTSELKKTGYTINETDKGIRCFGTVKSFSVPRWLINANQDESDGIGYDKSQPIDVGNGETSHLSKILTQMSTYMINVPVLKDHGKAGITLSLKNHYGTIDNPHDLHANYCDPFVGKINAAPQIKEKTKLIICDAAFGIYKGGPLGAPQWKHNSILASTDPVALDYTGMQIINAQRKKHNLDMVTQKAIHVKTAQTLGLGTSDPDKILLKESVLS